MEKEQEQQLHDFHEAEQKKHKQLVENIQESAQLIGIQHKIQNHTQEYLKNLEIFMKQQQKLQEIQKKKQEKLERQQELLQFQRQQEIQYQQDLLNEKKLQLEKEKEKLKEQDQNQDQEQEKKEDEKEKEENKNEKDNIQELEIQKSAKKSKFQSKMHSKIPSQAISQEESFQEEEDEDFQEQVTQEFLVKNCEELVEIVQEYQKYLENNEEKVSNFLSRHFQYTRFNPPDIQDMKRFGKFLGENFTEFQNALKQQLEIFQQSIKENENKLLEIQQQQEKVLEASFNKDAQQKVQEGQEINFQEQENLIQKEFQVKQQQDQQNYEEQLLSINLSCKIVNSMFIKTSVLSFKHVLDKQFADEDDLMSLPSLQVENYSLNLTKSNVSKSSKASDFLDEKIQNPDLQKQLKLNNQIQQLKEKGHLIGDDSYCVHHNPHKNTSMQKQYGSNIQMAKNKAKLQYFCQNCEELCCENCISTGPHNNRLHKIIPIKIFQDQQINKISKLIENDLGQKREKILGQQEKLLQTQSEIEKAAYIIEKDINIQFDGIFKRLSDAEGSKISILQKDITKLQRHINDIEDFATVFDRLTEDDEDQLKFLFMYKKIKNQESKLQAISVNSEIKQYPYDLPRELSQLKILLKEVESNDEIIKFRSKVIYELFQIKKNALEQVKLQETEKFQKEFDYWIDLADRLNDNYLNKNLICFYCGELMGLQALNGTCQRNKEYLSQPSFKGYTTKRPPKDFNGCKRHFFAEPIVKYRTPQLGKLNKLPNNDQWQSEILYYNTIKTLSVTFRKLKRLLIENQINLQEEFEKLEKPEKKGLVNVVQFEYVLNSILGLEEKETHRLTNFVLQKKPEKKKQIVNQYGGSGGYNSNYDFNKKNEEDEEDEDIKKSDDLINFTVFVQLIEDQSSLEARAQKILNVDRLIRMQEEYFITIDKQYINNQDDQSQISQEDIDQQNNFNNRSKYEQYKMDKQNNSKKQYGSSSYGRNSNSYVNSYY